ncbi:hypothetical protein DL93DRAFT_2085540 [Clavulina sp. PMI_390]|nr:hypothetical protein DL93DRAFT_2085540 [Clavulina sp. PMI_390]
MFFWRSRPTIEDIQAHIDEIHLRVTELDRALERAPQMSLMDAAWIGRATYRLGTYLGTCAADTRRVPDPVDREKLDGLLQQVRDITPAVISVCDRTARAKADFERLLIISIVRIQLRSVASQQRAFSDALLNRSPEELRPEGEQIANRILVTFDQLLAVYGITLQGGPLAVEHDVRDLIPM